MDSYNNVAIGHVFATNKEVYLGFPAFFQYCDGYNDILGPSRQVTQIIFTTITTMFLQESK